MTRLIGVLVLVLILVPVVTLAQNFDCRDQAFDLSTVVPANCPDATDLSTCPLSCTRPTVAAVPARCFVLAVTCADPDDHSTCTVSGVPEELPRLLNGQRAGANQPLLRRVTVHSGPHADVILSKVALNEIADGVFTTARDRLCVTPPPTSPTPGPGTPPPVGNGPGVNAGSPGLIGGNPGLIGGNPGLVGGNPGINIRR